MKIWVITTPEERAAAEKVAELTKAMLSVQLLVLNHDDNINEAARLLLDVNPSLVILMDPTAVERGLPALLEHHRIRFWGPTRIVGEALSEFNQSVSKFDEDERTCAWFLLENQRLSNLGYCQRSRGREMESVLADHRSAKDFMMPMRRHLESLFRNFPEVYSANGIFEVHAKLDGEIFAAGGITMVPNLNLLVDFLVRTPLDLKSRFWQQSLRSNAVSHGLDHIISR